MDDKIISIDEAFQIALIEAEKGASFVSPNPLVGCAIVNSNNQLLSTGYHARFGEAHAEIDALKKLKPEQLKNATVYVTLEPCAHEGKTPSCAKALAQLPIKKVIYGLQDPNPLVSGKGADILRQAGIEAIEYFGPLKKSLEELCEVFLKNFIEKKIFIAAKIASSLDGQIALKSGESRWITGSEAREKVHELRARYDAVLVGRKTIEIDDPSLNIRHPKIKKDTKLIILDPAANLLKQINSGKDFQFLKLHEKNKIYFAVKNPDLSFDFQQIPFKSLTTLCEEIWQLNIRSIFIEGGAQTYSSFFQENLIDRLHLFLAPSLIGATRGISWTESLDIKQLKEKRTLQPMKVETFGADLYLTAKLNH